jgi:NAD(P)-dependent dehydrogenase (short-subunit alcohol dehydrogenase family)
MNHAWPASVLETDSAGYLSAAKDLTICRVAIIFSVAERGMAGAGCCAALAWTCSKRAFTCDQVHSTLDNSLSTDDFNRHVRLYKYYFRKSCSICYDASSSCEFVAVAAVRRPSVRSIIPRTAPSNLWRALAKFDSALLSRYMHMGEKKLGVSSNSGPLVWFVTGTSQGFGQEIVRVALSRGDYVTATSRNPKKVAEMFESTSDRLLAISLDLRDDQQIKGAVAAAAKRFGRIDVIVNNAGHGLLGAIEEAQDVEIASVFETNVFGLLRVTRAALPFLREQRSGHVVNLSSIGGLVGLPGWGIYNATKFAVEGISEALAAELAPLGIGVTAVEPGPFRTDFLGGSLATAAGTIPDYDQTAGSTRIYRDSNNGVQAGDPRRAAEAIVNAVVTKTAPLHLLLGKVAYDRATKKLEALRDGFETWRDITLSTDYAKP